MNSTFVMFRNTFTHYWLNLLIRSCVHRSIWFYVLQAAKEVVLAEKPLISEVTDCIEPALLNELLSNIGTLSSVYHKPVSAFTDGAAYKPLPVLQSTQRYLINHITLPCNPSTTLHIDRLTLQQCDYSPPLHYMQA